MATLYVKSAGGNSNAAGTWSNVNSAGVDSSGPPANTDDCIAELGSGQLTINATLNCKTFSAIAGTGNWTGTLTHGNFNLNAYGNVTFSPEMTYTTTGAVTQIAFNSVAATLISAGKLMNLVLNQSTALVTLGDNLSFKDSKLCSFYAATSSSYNLAGFTVSGFSATSRVIVRANTLGTPITIVVASGTFANADFRDITFSSASNLDLSAITGLAGNAGGNTITGGGTVLTFTTPATQTWDGSTGNASTSASWTSRTPLPQDGVIVSSGTVTFDMPRSGGDITFSGTGNGTFSSATEVYGSLILRSGMTYTQSATISLMSRTTSTLTGAGNTFTNLAQTAILGTYTLGSALILSGTYTLTNGSFIDDGFSISVSVFSSTNSNTRAITRSGTWTVTGAGTPYTHATATGLTLTDSGTVFLTNIAASTKTFAGGGKTYNNLKIAAASVGSDVVAITGANTFNRIYTDGAGTKTITLPGSTTTTLLSGEGLGNGANIITFTASAGSATVSRASGNVTWYPVNLTNIIGTGGATFYAGSAPPSVDGGGNTGWSFTNAPSGSGVGTGRGMKMSIGIMI